MRSKIQISKKILSVLLCVLVLFSCVPMSVISASAEGAPDITVTIDTEASVTLKDTDGDTYYEIGTADELYAFASAVNGGSKTSINGELTADITVNTNVLDEDNNLIENGNYRVWTPIGNSSTYRGNFNGNDHTISGLYFNDSTVNYVGIFGLMYSNSGVKNLSLTNSYFSGNSDVAGIVGYIYNGTVEKCTNTAVVKGKNLTGGVIGRGTNTTLVSCVNKGIVICDETSTVYSPFLGGIVGNSSNSSISDSYNIGKIIVDVQTIQYPHIGGIVGSSLNTSIDKCHNKGEIFVSADSPFAGGISGRSSSGEINNCYNIADITGNAKRAGGISGDNSGTIKNCYNTGTVTGTSTGNYVGGVAGLNGGTIKNCYNTGTVTGNYVGGVTGYSNGTITNCYYLTDTCTGGINGKDVTDSAEAKTDEQFKSGEVAYLLQDGVTAEEGEEIPEIWGQLIGTDKYPVPMNNNKVYKVTNCKEEIYYSNTNQNGHIIVDVEKNDVTCEKDGNTAGTKCVICGETNVEIIPSKGHKYDDNGFCTGCKGYQPATDSDDDSYYEIDNAGKLYWFAQQVNNGNTTINAVLTTDITVNTNVLDENGELNESDSYRAWTPIGDFYKEYKGYFDGCGYTISGLYFNDTTAEYVGLFGYVGEGGTVSYTGVVNSYFNGSTKVGGVVGTNNNGTIEYCYNTSTIIGAEYIIGGVVGENYNGSIENCYNAGTVTGNTQQVGGVAGSNCGTITNSYNTGTVTGSDTSVGGVVGYNDSTITNCYNTGTVSSSGNSVGGVAGRNNEGTVTNCYNTATVSGSGSYVGGIVGHNQGTATNSYYLTGTCTGGIEGEDVAGSAEAKTAEQFESGEVAYLLDNGQYIWGQLIGTDNYPTISDDTVYEAKNCKDETIYTNVDPEYYPYDFHAEFDENGFCTNTECTNGYQIPVLANGEDGWSMVYLISNAGELLWLRDFVNSGMAGDCSAKLTADINLNKDFTFNSDGTYTSAVEGATPREWTPIENMYGNFDGNGKTISGIYCVSEYNYIGLFGYDISWNITNLTIANSYFEGDNNVGAISGYSENANISGCVIKEDVTVKGNGYVGGISGDLSSSGETSNCMSLATIVCTDGTYGGFAGSNSSAIINCYTTNKIFVGSHSTYYGNEFKNCYYVSDVENEPHKGLSSISESALISGELAYRLQAGVTADENGEILEIWGQRIDTDKYPVLCGDKVYQVTNCKDETFYSNTYQPSGHIYTNGFCEVCDAYQPAIENKDNYYEISNAGQLYWFANEVNNNSNTSVNAILTDNITVNTNVIDENGELNESDSYRAWTPIGNNSNKYIGHFDGCGYTISGLYFSDSTAQYVGLFGYSNGTIENVGVKNSYFFGKREVGGIVGDNNSGTVKNCYNTGGIVNGTTYHIGGLVGMSYLNSKLENSYNASTVISYGGKYVGGVGGLNEGTIKYCYNIGDVITTADASNYVGGVAGENGGVIEYCYNLGDVSGNGCVGGVVGYNAFNSGAKLLNCYNRGKVRGTGTTIGGVIGLNMGTVTNCYNTGNVSSARPYSMGGVAGSNSDSYGTITNCYYLSGAYAGGISGKDVARSAEVKTLDQFKSGEVAYLLQGNQSAQIWSQKIDVDNTPEDYPVLGSENKVYNFPLSCKENHFGFTNHPNQVNPPIQHSFNENGFCIDCDGYQPATQNAEGYYEINNAGKLYWFAQQVNSGNNPSIKGVLTADIKVNDGNMSAETDSSNVRKWVPIGNWDMRYNGHFNGNGYEISGLYYNDDTVRCVALFGYLTGTVENVGVVNSYFNGRESVGAIAGRNAGKVTDSYSESNYVIAKTFYAGGIAGENFAGTITNCHNTGEVSNTGTYAGGIAGQDSNGTIINCYNTGKISCGKNYLGGIVGYAKGIITNCYNKGEIIGTGEYVGGIVGNSLATVTNCYNAGTVTNGTYVGGIAGQNAGSEIINCYNTGTVTGDDYVGDIAGTYYNATFKNCYYLADSETDTLDDTTCKTKAQFNSGEVAYLLQSGVTAEEGEEIPEIWGQKLDVDNTPDNFPVLGSKNKVYLVNDCKGETVYSNTDAVAHLNYNSTHVCKDCGRVLEKGHIAGIAGYKLSLGSNIAVNYYMLLDESVVNDETAKVVFTVPNYNNEPIPVSKAKREADGKGGYFYVFTCEVPAKEMASTITCQVVTENGTSDTFTYSVKQYADYMLENADDYKNYPTVIPLVKAMLNYGAYSQLYFKYNTNNLANASLSESDKALDESIDLSSYAYSVEGSSPLVISLYGAILSLESETSIKLYLRPSHPDFDTLNVKINGQEVKAKKNGGYFEVKITDIPAHKLDDMYTVEVDGLKVTYGVFSYGNSAMGTNKDTLKNVIRAMYTYNQTAKAYSSATA